MSFFKQASFNNTLVVILIAINIVCLYYLIMQPPTMKGKQHILSPGRHHKTEHALAKRLGFSDQQKNEFLALNKKHHNEMKSLMDRRAQLNKELFDNLNNSSFDSEMKCDEIGSICGLEKRTIYAHFKEVRLLCDETQKLKFDKFVKNVSKRMDGPQHRRKNPDGPLHR